MKTGHLNDGKLVEEIDRLINENKRRIKLLTEINAQLGVRRNQQNRIRSLLKEGEELEKELFETKQKVNNAWNEKIDFERMKTAKLEKEWKELIQEIQANADTPGYQQALKHTDLQGGVHKDVPSTRTNYKITATRLQNEIKNLQDTVNKARLSLIDEIKKKTSLEEELREMRASMSNRRSVTPTRFTSSIPELNLPNGATRV